MDDTTLPNERHRHTRTFIPALAVLAVALAAVATTWFTTRPLTEDRGRPPPLEVAVVRAPPIEAPNTAVMGAAPSRVACANCGVVEAVVMLQNHSLFQMKVKMNDGSYRTVEQPVPMVAGSRVIVEGGRARPAPVNSTQG